MQLYKKEDELDGFLDSCDVEFGTPSNKYISLSVRYEPKITFMWGEDGFMT